MSIFCDCLTDFLLQAIQNLGTALITMGAGSIVDEYVKDCTSSASSKSYYFSSSDVITFG